MRFKSVLTGMLGLGILAMTSFAQETALSELDKDSDKKVSVAEFQQYASDKLPGFDKLEKFAAAVDSNSDGVISATEFENRMQVLQQLTAGDSDSPAKSTDGKENDKDSDIEQAKKLFKKIGKLVQQDKWQDLAQLMTPKAQDEFVVEQVMSAVGLAKMNVQFPVPGLEDAIDEIDNALVKHGIDELKIDTSGMFEMKMSLGDEDEEDDESAENDAAGDMQTRSRTESTRILAHVKESGKRWEIVKDIWNAKKGSPFAMSPLNGKIQNSEQENDVTFLHVNMAPSSSDDDSGVVIQMVAPPVVMRIVQQDGVWKLDGRDSERSNKAMKEFMKNHRGLDPPSQRQDF